MNIFYRCIRYFAGACLAGTMTFPAQATLITFDVTNIAGNIFEYTYTVQNGTFGVDIEEFTIYFDVNLFQNLSFAAASAGWDPLVVQPDAVLADDGFYDALALAVGIAPGDTLGGFSVRADFLGAGTPGAQPFEIFDPLTFALVDSGTTVRADAVAVAEPASMWIFALGFLAIAGAARRLS